MQTDWSGGPGQDAWHDARRYDAGNGVHVYTVGEVTLGYTAPAGGALANLSQDGFPDLIIGKNRYGTSLLCHGGTDGFAMQRCQPLALRGCGPIWADFNNDGFFDIALMGDVDGSFGVYYGSASGYSESNRVVVVGNNPWQAAAGDVDNDGDLDLVIADDYTNVRIYWNIDGTFSLWDAQVISEEAPNSPNLADVNKDGYLDLLLLVASQGTVVARIYWGGPSGYSTSNRITLMPDNPTTTRVADFNHDGYFDIVYGANGNAVIYWGSVSGYSDSNRTIVPTGATFVGSVADLNSDGWDDLLVANGSDAVLIVWGRSSGFSMNNVVSLPQDRAIQTVVADFNRDGYPDIATAGWENPPMHIYWGSASGYSTSNRQELTWGIEANFAVIGSPYFSALAYHGTTYGQPITEGVTVTDALRVPTFFAASGVITSSIYDQLNTAWWNSLVLSVTIPAGTGVQIAVDTSNDGITWTGWHTVDAVGSTGRHTVDLIAAGVPPSRFLRYRATLTSSADHHSTPTLYEVSISGAGAPSTATPTATPIPSYNDEFSESSLNPRWTWAETTGLVSYEQTSRPGYLHVRLPGNYTAGFDFPDPPRLTQRITGDFTVSTRIEIGGDNYFHSMGLLLWLNTDNYIVLRHSSTWHYLEFGKMQNAIFGQVATLPWPDDGPFFLMLQRLGSQIIASYSSDGVNWNQIAATPTTLPGTIDLGLMMTYTHWSLDSFEVYFDWFQVKQPTPTDTPTSTVTPTATETPTPTSTTVPPICVAPPSGLIDWWPAEGSTVDVIGPNHASLQNGATFGAGKVGQAFSLDGIDDYLIANDSGLPMGSSSRTMEFWFLMQPSSYNQIPVVYGSNQINNSFYMVRLSDHVCIGQPGGGPLEVCGSTIVANNQWYHAALTYDGSNTQLYLNGQLEASATRSYNTTSTGHLYVGQNAGFEYYAGLVDEISIYNRALSTAEMLAIYNAGSAGKCKSGAATLTPTPTSTSAPPTPTLTPTSTSVPPTPTPTPTSTSVSPTSTPTGTTISPTNTPTSTPTRTPTWTPTRTPTLSPATFFRDDFNGSMSNLWAIQHQDSAYYTITPDHFELRACSGDLHSNDVSYKNLFLIDAPTTGDFDITMHVNEFVPVSNFASQLNLVIYDDGNNFIRSIYGYIWGSRQLEFGAEVGGAWGSNVSNIDFGTSLYYFRVRKVGNVYTQYYSLDGVDFQQRLGPVTFGDGTPGKVGFAAMVDPTESSLAKIDWIEVSLLDSNPTATPTATTTPAAFFSDDYESYALGVNPTDFYDYRSVSEWSPPGAVWPDRFKVGQVGNNKVLQYHYDGPSNHAPTSIKLYKQHFDSLSEVGATFYYTAQAMGWNSVVFEYQDNQHYYWAGYTYSNRLYISGTQPGVVAYVDLWPDIDITAMNNRVELKRIDNQLVATITRLDTLETKTVDVIAPPYAGGAAGFRSLEDWGGGIYVNVDDFYVKGITSGTLTPTPTPTNTPTNTPTSLPGATPTPTLTPTSTYTPTPTGTGFVSTNTPTPTSSNTPTATPTNSPTPTPGPTGPVPVVTGIDPISGYNTQLVWVTITGRNFAAGSVAKIGITQLQDLSMVNSTQLLGAVPPGITPGVHAVQVCNPGGQCGSLPDGFTVMGSTPNLLSIMPNQGFNDAPNDIVLYGFNLQPGVTISLGNTPLQNVQWQNATRLNAVVPIDWTPGTYDVVARNVGSPVTSTLLAGYTVLDPGGDDFSIGAEDIWLSPTTVRQGEQASLGINIRRHGGKKTVQITADFYLGDPAQGGQFINRGLTPPMPPGYGVVESIMVNWDTASVAGPVSIYVVIDPENLLQEDSKANNQAWRDVTILPPAGDQQPPYVTDLVANGGAAETTDSAVTVTIVAEDSGGSGLSSMYLVEREFNSSARQWVAIQNTGWVAFQSPYAFSLTGRGGARYLQIWVSDGAGNISEAIFKTRIDYMPPSDSVLGGQVRVYRRYLEAGKTMNVLLETLSGDADLYVWSPDGNRSWVSNNSGLADDAVSVLATVGGTFQIEVFGYSASTYRLTTSAHGAKFAQALMRSPNAVSDKSKRTQPIISPGNEPEGNSAVPAAPVDADPLGHKIFLPFILAPR